jgi:hypothetical protein
MKKIPFQDLDTSATYEANTPYGRIMVKNCTHEGVFVNCILVNDMDVPPNSSLGHFRAGTPIRLRTPDSTFYKP